MLTDTHTHLYLPQFDEDRDEAVARAKAAGVGAFYLPNVDSSTIGPLLALEAAHAGCCFAMMGLHPCSVKGNFEEELGLVKKWLWERPFCAVGEIGIDLYWDKSYFEQQKVAFLRQIGWAKELGLPIIIHSREATEVIIELLQKEKDGRLRGIFHCFSGDASQAEKITELGFYLGIGGVLTYKNGGLGKSLENIGLEHMVLETDSPYLAPVPNRGKRNESSNIMLIAAELAAMKGVNVETVAAVTTANAEKIFGKNS